MRARCVCEVGRSLQSCVSSSTTSPKTGTRSAVNVSVSHTEDSEDNVSNEKLHVCVCVCMFIKATGLMKPCKNKSM